MDMIGTAGALGWADSTYSGSQVSSNTVDSTMDSTPSSGEEGGVPLRRYGLLLGRWEDALDPDDACLPRVTQSRAC